MSRENKDKALHIGSVIHGFDCFLCGGSFNGVGEPCVHYNCDEMDEEGEVSLCSGCLKEVMNKAKKENTKGLSRRFFNCG